MIVDIRAEPRAEQPLVPPVTEPQTADPIDDVFELEEPLDARGSAGKVAAGIAICLVVAWIVAAVWYCADTLALLTPVELVQFVAALAVVPALVGVLWLLAMRTSRAEARRFGASARAMRAEAAKLERTIAAMARQLDWSRQALAEQASSFANIGDVASQRMVAIGRDLASEVGQADAHARALADVAKTTQSSLDVLLASLPRAQAETINIGKVLDETGLTANGHAAALDAQLVALVNRGREADLVASGAAQRLAAHIARMEATSETASARLEAVTGDMSNSVDALLGRTADAVDEARKGIAAQGDAMLAMLGANQAGLNRAAHDSADALAARIATVDQVIERLAMRLDVQRIEGHDIVAGLESGLGRVEQRLDTLHREGVERTSQLTASIDTLGGSATSMADKLRSGDTMASQTIETSEALLVALDAVAREIDETLPAALSRLDSRIAASHGVVVQAKPELLALVTAAESTHDAIAAIATVIADQRRTLDHLSATLLQTLSDGRDKSDALGTALETTIEQTHRLAEDAAPRLVEALLRVRETAGVAADKARETLAAIIPEAADALGVATADAMRRATGDTVERQIIALNEATGAAVDATTRATERLALQVQAIEAHSAAVDTRIEGARNERETSERESVSRQVAALIESLNSASIDVTKTFGPEVPDSAWAAYLEGDRGVFTRRAVRLLGPTDAKAIGQLYNGDPRFRDMVNQYIHDFESMLRSILAQRDGTNLGIILLSSDMGKLYVALAQAIERLT